MAALLLWCRADPMCKANGKSALNALQLAEKMAADPTCKQSAQAALIVTLIQDPEALRLRWEAVRRDINEAQARGARLAKIVIMCIYGSIAAFWVLWYVHIGRQAAIGDVREL